MISQVIASNRGVPIQMYTLPLKTALMNIKMRPLLQLQSPFILPESIQHNLIWHCIGMFSRLHPQCPSSSKYMQSVARGDYPGKSETTFLPIIDLKSTDESCIYSTLLFIQRQAKILNLVTACITFNQPLWKLRWLRILM